MSACRVALCLGLLAGALQAGAARPCSFYGVGPAAVWQSGANGTEYLENKFSLWLPEFQSTRAASVRLPINKNQGDADYTRTWPVYDDVVRTARENGIEVLVLVTPDWDFPPPGTDNSATNPWVVAMENKVVMLIDHYGSAVRYYEILNEPNCCPYVDPYVYNKVLGEIWSNHHDTLTANGVSLVYASLYASNSPYAVDPTVYLSSSFSDGIWSWLQANRARLYPWDYFAFHPYADRNGAMPQTDMGALINQLQAFKVRYSDYTPLFITEFGWSTSAVNDTPGWHVDANTQAANLDNALTYFESRGDVSRTFVFRFDEWDGYGLYANAAWDGTAQPKPAVAVLQRHAAGCSPVCAVASDPCSGAGDCCPGLSCDLGHCSTCRPAGGACAVTADCCSGLACEASAADAGPTCAVPPDGGEGASDAGRGPDAGAPGTSDGGTEPRRPVHGCGCTHPGPEALPWVTFGALAQALGGRRRK